MIYLNINFSKKYSSNEKVYLKDFLPEKDGIKFIIRYWRKILNIKVKKLINVFYRFHFIYEKY